MRCPFCHQTIEFEFEFRAGAWVAMRDGREHACVGLLQAQAKPKTQVAQKSAPQADLIGDIPAEAPRAPVIPQDEDYPPWEDPPAATPQTPAPVASSATTAPIAQKPRKSTRPRNPPTQLELQALD
jgi:hypothetical protein